MYITSHDDIIDIQVYDTDGHIPWSLNQLEIDIIYNWKIVFNNALSVRLIIKPIHITIYDNLI